MFHSNGFRTVHEFRKTNGYGCTAETEKLKTSMAKKKERKKTYKFIERLIDKVTTSKSNNTEFVCYGHLVELLSGTEDYVSVTIYNTDDRYGGEMADFNFDYLTKELHFVSSEGKALTEKIIATFRMFYSRRIRVSYDELDYEDEDTTYEYDETDEYAPPVKHLNK